MGNWKQNHFPKLSPDDKIDDLRTSLTDIGAKLSVGERVNDCVQGGLCHLGEDRLQVSCSAFFLFTSWSMEALIPLTHWSQVIDTSSGAAQVGPHIHSAWNWKPHNQSSPAESLFWQHTTACRRGHPKYSLLLSHVGIVIARPKKISDHLPERRQCFRARFWIVGQRAEA